MTFTFPGSSIVGIYLNVCVISFEGLTKVSNSLIVVADFSENNAVACPGIGVVGISPDGFIKAFNSFVVITLHFENKAY